MRTVINIGDTRFLSFFIVLPFFDSHGIYQEQAARFDRYLFAFHFSPDSGDLVAFITAFELLLIEERGEKRRLLFIFPGFFLIYRGVV